jgi:hypothetical protein
MVMILLAFYKKKKTFFPPQFFSNSCYPPNFFLHFLSLIPFFCSKLFFNLKKVLLYHILENSIILGDGTTTYLAKIRDLERSTASVVD